MRTSVDTNALSAVVNRQQGFEELASLLTQLSSEGPLVASAPVWVELAGLPYSTPGKVESLLRDTAVRVDFDLGHQVWASAATAYGRYFERRRKSAGGSPRRLVTDFLIGAHALVSADRLITGDARFFGETFPGLSVIPIPGTSA